MAGGVLKGFGGVLLALGVLLFIAGAIAAVYGLVDEQQNRDNAGPAGVGYDRDRSEAAGMAVMAGAVAAGVGLVFSIIGIILLAAGSGRANRALVQSVAASRQAPTTATGATSAAPTGATAAVTSSSAGAPAAKRSDRVVPGPAPTRSGKAIGAGVAATFLVGLAIAILVLGFGPGNLGSLVNADPTPATTFAATGEAYIASGPFVDGDLLTNLDGRQAEPFVVPAGTARIDVNATWSSGTGCCARLAFTVQRDADGSWTDVASQEAPSGLVWSVALDGAAEGTYRIVAEPVGDGLSSGHSVAIEVTGWNVATTTTA